MEAKERSTFTPKEEVVVVKPIMRSRNPLVTDPDHEAFFLVGNATINYSLPVDRHGNLINPFTSKAEQEWLENELDLDLNIHKGVGNYWKRFKVKLGKDSRRLNLANPKHYIEYLVLKANSLYIAPNGDSVNNKATYRYALVTEEYETKATVKKSDKLMEAYMALGKLKDSKEDMMNFLKVYGKKVAPHSKSDFLMKQLQEIIDADIDGFLAVANDKEDYEYRLLIAEAVEAGAIIKEGRKYSLPGGDPLASPGEVASLANAVKYLKYPGNQDLLTALKARVANAKD